MPAIGEPECQIPSSRWPRVRTITGAFCPPARAPAQRGEVVGQDLQRVEQVVEVLDLGDRAQPAHRHADRLADDGGLADAGVGDAQLAVLLLQVRRSPG